MPTHEAWRPVPGFEGLYSISSRGRVRSESRVVVYEAGKRQTVRERVMSPARKASGHLSVMLYGPAPRRLHVHQMVALAFIGPAPSALHEIAHRDGDPSNNTVRNLRWATCAENHADKVAHGTHNRGERHPLSRLTNDQVLAIRSSAMSTKQIAEVFGINQRYAWALKAGKRRSQS